MRKGLIGVGLLVLAAGCSAAATPNFYNGQYYLAGDANCVRMNSASPTRINCFNSKGQNTGYRDAMSPQAAQAYHAMQIQQQMADQQMVNQVIQNSRSRQTYCTNYGNSTRCTTY